MQTSYLSLEEELVKASSNKEFITITCRRMDPTVKEWGHYEGQVALDAVLKILKDN